MKLLALFLAVLTVAYLLPFSVLAEKTMDDAVIRGEIEVSGNSEASYPDETNGRTPERKTEIFFDDSDDASLTFTNSYQFATTDNETSALISQYTSTVAPTGGTSTSTTYKYTYDANGNITEIRNQANTLLYRYAYDMKGQLIREDNQPQNRTFLYSYDDAGNILSKIGYRFLPEILTENLSAEATVMNRIFTYGSDGRLSKFRGDINYDEIGNPDSYQRTELKWQNGRQLARFGTYTYTYNADGLRTSKSNNGVLTNEYILNGSQVMRQLIYANGVTYVADYLYHENGTPMAFAYYQENGTPVYYFYETNIQGDIVNVYNENGVRVLGHRYDAYGITSTDKYNTAICTDTFLQAVLFAYRGYIYDSETALYYLQSRYYAPDICRFLNADGYVSTGQGLLGYNMYAYCSNNPVMFVDPTGEFAGELAAMGIGGKIVAAFATAASSIISAPAVAIAVGVALVAIVATIAISMALNTSNDTAIEKSTEDELGEIAGNYDNLQCVEAQKAMTKYLKKNNKHGKIIQIRYEGDFIYSNSRDMVVSQNGFHTGVEYKGIVFCNIHPYGLRKDLWLEDFDGVGQRTIHEIPF